MLRSTLLIAVLLVAGCSASQVSTLGNVDTNLAVASSPTADRKIIFEASLKLIVPDLSQLEQQIPTLAKDHGGFLANVGVDRRQSANPTGHWVARIPVKQYEAFLKKIAELGVLDTFDQKSQDVTEEYVDLETRIANEKHLESRVLEILKRPEDEIKDVIEVERELARVRGEIEKMEGRVRFLANRTEFTTVTIDAFEQQVYVPVAAPGLWARVEDSWKSSISTIRHAGEDMLVALAGLLPWLPLIAIVAVPLFLIFRRKTARVAA